MVAVYTLTYNEEIIIEFNTSKLIEQEYEIGTTQKIS